MPELQCKFEALPGGAFGAPVAVPELPAFLVNVFDNHVAHMSEVPLPAGLAGVGLPVGGDALGPPAVGVQRSPDTFGGAWVPGGSGGEGLGLDFEDDDECSIGVHDGNSLEGLHNNRTAGGAGKRLSLAELQARPPSHSRQMPTAVLFLGMR